MGREAKEGAESNRVSWWETCRGDTVSREGELKGSEAWGCGSEGAVLNDADDDEDDESEEGFARRKSCGLCGAKLSPN